MFADDTSIVMKAETLKLLEEKRKLMVHTKEFSNVIKLFKLSFRELKDLEK